MNRVVTSGIVLARTNFGEADRILTVLTPDNGKVSLMAKGVRKVKSKLAGGIELFSVSHITYIPGKGSVSTLISSRLETHFGNIVKDIGRTMYGYEVLKTVHTITEDNAGPEYFELCEHALGGLNDSELGIDFIKLWFLLRLLKLGGHSPNLKTDKAGNKLTSGQSYTFDLDNMVFTRSSSGRYNEGHIKLLRLGIGLDTPEPFLKLRGVDDNLPPTLQLAEQMARLFMRI